MGYFEDLRGVWQSKKGRPHGSEIKRPKSIRGRDFVNELLRLSVLTKDRRFDAALKALLEHGIIDARMNFARWTPPELAKMDKEEERIMLIAIRFLMDHGMSQRRACATIAANAGLMANSFDAAVRRLELISSDSGAA